MFIEKIKSPLDIKGLNIKQLNEIANEIRAGIINRVSKMGGHLGPNLGFVEATIALHYVFDAPKDKFVFDVSHQCYAHKILTGRWKGYVGEVETMQEISGYTSPQESPEYDQFEIGHTSTSVSLATGLQHARDIKGTDENIVAIIGDGSLSGGEAFEGLDEASELGTGIIIVVNDNEMSIAENHGGLYKNLELLRNTNGKAECNFFKAMGFEYKYLEEGNNIEQLIELFKSVKGTNKPTILHIHTEKGRGFMPATVNKEYFHWGAPFNPEEEIKKAQGITFEKKSGARKESYEQLFSNWMLNAMERDKTVVAVNAAVPAGGGFTPNKRQKAGRNHLDMGIAEEQACAMISGMAKGGLKPVWYVHSTFIQRAYDQIAQDLCINSNPAVINVTLGGTGTMNDITHICLYDIPMLTSIPNLLYLAPTNCEEYFAMLNWAVNQDRMPIALRMPSNGVYHSTEPQPTTFSYNAEYKIVHKGSKVAIIAAGSFFQKGENVVKILSQKGIDATLINPRYLSSVDEETLNNLKSDHKLVVTLEDGSKDGGFGERIASYYGTCDMKVLVGGIKKGLYDRFDQQQLLSDNRLLDEQIVEDILKLI